MEFRSLLRTSLALSLLVFATAVSAVTIPATQAASGTIPAIPGDGVSIKLYNRIGGGTAPSPAAISGRTPDGTTLSPYIDFPQPGVIINVGQNFSTFFASTANPPDQVKSLAAGNFILEIDCYLLVTYALDRDTSTPGIDVRLGVGSDDGFYLVAGSTLLGSTGDRGFSTSAFDVTFEQPGLYPIKLLFAANSVGQSGLEFYWQTSGASGLQLVPQSALYTTTVQAQQLINFDDQAAGTIPAAQYRNRGLVLSVPSGTVQITNALPSDFVPITQPNVVGCPTSTPMQAQTLEMSFVVPGTTQPAITDFVEFYLIDADTAPGAHIVATNQHGETVYDQNIVTGGGVQQKVTISVPQLFRIRLELGGAGTDTSAIDNLAFNTPVAADLTPPRVAGVRVASSGVEIDFAEAVGLDTASVTQLQNYVLRASGGDGSFGEANDVTVSLASAVMLDGDTVRLNPSGVPTDEVYRVKIKESPGVKDAAGNLLDGDNDGNSGGEFQQALTLDLMPATLQVDMQSASDTGIVDDDNVTSQTRPTFDVTVNKQGTLALSIDGQQAAMTQAVAGTQTFTVPDALVDGSHSLGVTFSAALPPGSSVQRSLPFVVDTTPPVVRAVLFNNAPLSDGATVRQSGTLAADVVDGSGVNRVEFRVRGADGNDVLVATDTTSGDGFFAFWDAASVPQGEYVLTLRAYDLVNGVTVATRNLTKRPPLPVLTLALAQPVAAEGGTVGGTVSLNGTWPQDVVVSLGVTTANRITFPAAVKILSGQISASFSVQALQNSVVEPAINLTMIASSPDLTAVTTALQIADDDTPGFQFTLDRNIVSEDAGAMAVRGTLTLSHSTNVNLVATFASSPDGQISLPASVRIPANTLSVRLPIAILDNAVMDGNRTVSIGGHAGLNTGAVLASLAPVLLTITDNESPSLSLAFNRTLLLEGRNPATTATVSVKPVSVSPLTVSLSASDPGA
ncbi:MAG: Ig-like domain-containing protein, partial [Roseimicrobium sp.]